MGKVFIITNSLAGGGAERAMNIVASELHESLNYQKLVTLIPINAGPKDLVVPTCEIIEIGRNWRGNPFSTLKSLIYFVFKIIRERPQLLIVNCALPELFTCLLPLPVKFIVVEHSRQPWLGREKLGRIVRKILSARNAKFVLVSNHLEVWALPHEVGCVIRNPILRPNVEQKNGATEELKRLVYIGRLAADKNPQAVIELSKMTGFPALIIGDGLLMDELKHQTNSIEQQFDFTGHVLEPWKLLTSSDLLIVPSEFEGDGLVVAEGILASVAMLLSDIPEFRKFGLNENSYCKSIGSFYERIFLFKESLSQLTPPVQSVDLLIHERGITRIIDKWIEIINQSIPD